MDEIVHRILLFDRFALDLTRGCLRTGDRDIDLRPKTFRVLRHLAENAGRLVPKQELYEVVWSNIVVSDDSLVQCVRELRRPLGDDKYRLIKTVSRRGYLLDASVSTSDIPAARASHVATTGAAPHLLPSSHGTARLLEGEAIDLEINLDGERKHATVLQADLKDSLELVAKDHPEEALRILEAVLKLMRQAVYRYEGTVILETAYGIVALGRNFELEQLNRVQILASQGRGQVVAVVGEAGVGKSRLIYEFTRLLHQQG